MQTPIETVNQVYENYANSLNHEMPNLEIGQDRSRVKHYRAISDHLFSDLTLEKRHGSTKNVSLNKVGIGDVSCTKTFFENSSLDMSSFLPIGRDGWGRVKREIPIDVTTLDLYCQQNRIAYISTLKVDTQGLDLDVLKGSEDLLANHRIQLILMEITFIEIYDGIPPFDEVFRFLADRNFKLVSFYKFYYKNGLAGWTDALFINPDFTPFS
ncbi:MAG: FkbM family methyltransferase [Acidobacteriota bacterium]